MRRVRLWAFCASLLILAACAGGLLINEGNEYLCEPDAQPSRGTQDPNCPPTWSCSVNGRCAPSAVDVLPEGGTRVQLLAQPLRVYPRAGLDGPYVDVAGPSPEKALVAVFSESADAGFIVDVDGLAVQTVRFPDRPAGVELVDMAYTGTQLAAILSNGQDRGLFVPGVGGLFRAVELSDGGTLKDAFALRGLMNNADAGAAEPSLFVQRFRRADSDGVPSAGEVVTIGPRRVLREFVITQPDGGVASAALDARPIPRSAIVRRGCLGPVVNDEGVVPVVFAKEGLFYRRCARVIGPDEWEPLSGASEDPVAVSPIGEPPRLRTDPSYDLYAVSFALTGALKRQHTALSAWRLNRAGQEPSVTRAWQDCSPCGGGVVVAFAPTFISGVPAVDVACEVPASVANKAPTVRIVRVTGSAGSGVEESCAFSPFTPSFESAEIGGEPIVLQRNEGPLEKTRYAIADYLGNGLIIGGKHGQLWRGPSFDKLRPLFLDRVPESVSSLVGKPFVLTPDYTALHRPDIGLALVPERALVGADGQRLSPRSAPSDTKNQNKGWIVLEGSDLARLTYTGGSFSVDGGVKVDFGAPMVDSAGNRPPGPYFVEAVKFGKMDLDATPKQEGAHFVISAFDSIYVSDTVVNPERGVLPTLFPQLTPQPGAVIRSLVMNRTPNGVAPETGEGLPLAFGYAVAGRSVFKLRLVTGGAGAIRWVADELDVGAGEPISVFMKSETDGTALGRAAFRDGHVLTIPTITNSREAAPATVKLVDSLPTDFDGKPTTGIALSFANIGETPVALTEDGVWTPRLEATKSVYTWELHPLPAELSALPARERGERMKSARLAVLTEAEGEVLYLFTGFGFVYKLGTASK